MAYNQEYPYNSAERYNADWLLSEMNRLVEEWKKTEQVWENDHQAFLALQQYVENYFKNLDLTNEVSEKLDEMLADGTLSFLIGVDSSIHYNIEFMENAVGDNVIEGGLQGGTYLDNNRFVYAHVTSDSEPATIVIYNTSTNQMIHTFTHLIGHGNGCTFNPTTQELIFLDGASNTLYIFDSVTYDFKNSVVVQLGQGIIANGIGYLSQRATGYAQECYVLSTREKLYYVNLNYELINSYNLPLSSWIKEPSLQTIFTVEDKIVLCSAFTNRWYVMSFPNFYHKTIYVDSFGSPLCAYEIEAVGAKNLNEIYFASRCYSAGPQTVFIAKTSLLGDTPIDNNTFLSELRNGGYINIFVDEASTGIRNGSNTNPFSTVSEALSFAEANNIVPRIYLNSDISRSIFILTSCVLQGNSHTAKSLSISCADLVVVRNLDLNDSATYQYISNEPYTIGINCSLAVLYQLTISTHTPNAWDFYTTGYSTVFSFSQTAASANIFNKCACNGIIHSAGVMPRIADSNSILNGLKNYMYINEFAVPSASTPLPIPWRYGGQSHQFIFAFNTSSVGYSVSMNVGSHSTRYIVTDGQGIVVRFTLSASGNLSWESLGTTDVTSVTCYNIIQ